MDDERRMAERLAQYAAILRNMQRGEFDLHLEGAAPPLLKDLEDALLRTALGVERLFKMMQSLSALAERIARGSSLHETLDTAYAGLRTFIPFDRLGVALLESGGDVARCIYARSETVKLKLRVGYAEPLAGSSLLHVLSGGVPRVISDLQAYAVEHPKSRSTRLMLAEGLRSSLTCPLAVGGRPSGFVFFSSTEPDRYRDAHVQTFQLIAGQFAALLEKALLYEALAVRTEEREWRIAEMLHKLEQPFGTMRTSLQHLASEGLGKEDARHREVYNRLIGSLAQVSAVVSNLASLENAGPPDDSLATRPVDLAEVLNAAVMKHFETAERRNIRFSRVLPSSLPTVQGDPALLSQVFDRLVGCSVESSHPGTDISLCVREREGFVDVTLIDEGLGLSDQEIRAMLNPFGPSLVGSAEPDAMTLPRIKEVVRRHGGTARLETRIGVGTRFTVSLPVGSAARARGIGERREVGEARESWGAGDAS